MKIHGWLLALCNFDTRCGNPKIKETNFGAMMQIMAVIVSAWFAVR